MLAFGVIVCVVVAVFCSSTEHHSGHEVFHDLLSHPGRYIYLISVAIILSFGTYYIFRGEKGLKYQVVAPLIFSLATCTSDLINKLLGSMLVEHNNANGYALLVITYLGLAVFALFYVYVGSHVYASTNVATSNLVK